MRLTHRYLLALTTAALLAGATAPAFADDDPPPAPAYCFDDEGNLLNLEGCPGYRQASGH